MEFISSIWFYVVFSVLGCVGYGLTSHIFETKLTAYITSKVFGLILFGYGIWLLSSLHILNFQSVWVITGLLGVTAVCSLWYAKKLPATTPAESHRWFSRIAVWELASFVLYLAYLFVRSHNAEINGTERFMDMAFLSASGNTDYFPPVDPWFSGQTINYYYFGSYLVSLVSNIAQLPYALTYNFALGLIYSQSAVLVAGLVYTTVKSKLLSLWAAFMVTTAGTLYFAGCSLAGFIRGLSPVCSYASSTRLYTPSYIINEIPSYSFTVGDLHAHLLALPLFLAALYTIYTLTQSKTLRLHIFILSSITGAVLVMTNMWDAVTYIALLAVAALFRLYPLGRAKKITKEFWDTLRYFAALPVIIVLLILPFSLQFHSPVLGLGFSPLYVHLKNLTDVQYPTPLLALLGMWGCTVSLGVLAWKKMTRSEAPVFLHTLAVVSFGILLGVELFFVKDIYSLANPPYFRANTTFKFGYHAWSMLHIAAAIALGTVWTRLHTATQRPTKLVLSVLLIVSVGAGLVYPYQAITQFYTTPSPRTLDGSAWLAQKHPDDYATVNYIVHNTPKGAVIAEAVGDSYSEYARMATFSGRATPMGWKTHEWTWRLIPPKNPAEKNPETGWGTVSSIAADIEQLYTATTPATAYALAQQYQIDYIYVGNMERELYTTIDMSTLYAIGTPVFWSGSSVLIKISK